MVDVVKLKKAVDLQKEINNQIDLLGTANLKMVNELLELLDNFNMEEQDEFLEMFLHGKINMINNK